MMPQPILPPLDALIDDYMSKVTPIEGDVDDVLPTITLVSLSKCATKYASRSSRVIRLSALTVTHSDVCISRVHQNHIG